MGRSRSAKQGGSGRNNSPGQTTSTSSAKATLKAAEQAQQRGERRSGREAVPHLQEAIEKYRLCMSQSPDADTLANAQVLCSETLQVLAKANLDAEEQLPDAEQSIALERDAKRKALELYAEAVQVARQSISSSGGAWLRSDAAVNCGNFLSEAAELAPADQQVSLLMDAVSCYEAALNLEPDAVTWSNLADSLIQLSQALSSTQRLQDVEEAVTRARAAYQSSCSNSSAYEGDDLPGLLSNWGTGLATVAGLLRDAGVYEKAIEVHKEAIVRINCSLDMQPTDVQVHIALAEAHSGLLETVAELLAPDKQPSPSGASAAASAWQEAGSAALAACDAALNIQRDHVSALVVKAEVHALHAKILSHIGEGDGETCAQHWTTCVQCYEKVLGSPTKLGSFSERCTVRYNCSCALAMAGRAQDALALLTWLSRKHPDALAGSQEDTQLQSLWNLKEFQALLTPAVD